MQASFQLPPPFGCSTHLLDGRARKDGARLVQVGVISHPRIVLRNVGCLAHNDVLQAT